MYKKIAVVDPPVRPKVSPKALDLKSPAGRVLFLETVERVVRKHRDVLRALENR